MGRELTGLERTFLMIKPDGVRRGLIGEIIGRLERKGLKIVGLKLVWVDKEKARSHYDQHAGKPYYEPLVDYVTSSPSVAMVVEGRKAVEVVRKMVGATDPSEAEPGTIRGDLAIERTDVIFNLVHASDSLESARREIGLFFADGEIFDYDLASSSIHRV
jgi:nucleoside-diphosphate kinase